MQSKQRPRSGAIADQSSHISRLQCWDLYLWWSRSRALCLERIQCAWNGDAMATEMKPTLASFASSLTVSHRAHQWIEDEKAFRLFSRVEWENAMPRSGKRKLPRSLFQHSTIPKPLLKAYPKSERLPPKRLLYVKLPTHPPPQVWNSHLNYLVLFILSQCHSQRNPFWFKALVVRVRNYWFCTLSSWDMAVPQATQRGEGERRILLFSTPPWVAPGKTPPPCSLSLQVFPPEENCHLIDVMGKITNIRERFFFNYYVLKHKIPPGNHENTYRYPLPPSHLCNMA